MKKTLLVSFVVIVFVAAFRFALGFFPWHLLSALDVATGLGAKLACSGYYLSSQTEEQIIEDLASYSPATRLVSFDFSKPNHVEANLKGLSTATATYRPNLGCSLDIGDTSHLNTIIANDIKPQSGPWPEGTRVDTIDESLQSLVNEIVEQDNAEGLQTRALVVVKNGNVLAESYGPSVDKYTPLLGWSMGKSLTAIMVGRYDYLNENNSALDRQLFADWQDDRSKISLKDMMQMSSGLVFDETYAPGSDSTHMLFSAFSASDVALASALGFEPGTHFSYSSGTTNMIMRWLHERLGGAPQASTRFIQQELFAPLGMHTATFEMDPSGVFVGSSYIYASGRDWARLGWLMVNDGMFNGQRLLSSAWVADAESANDSENYPQYGYQFWLNSDNTGPNAKRIWDGLPAEAYFMMGNRKQVVMMLPSQKTVIVRLGWTSGSYPMEDRFSQILAKSEKLH